MPLSHSTATSTSPQNATMLFSSSELKAMANALRALSIDMVEQANSGHPGLPMGAADVATVLFAEHIRYDAKATRWQDRDRFILSAGHGSALIYSLLHLMGVESITLDELKRFRAFGSCTAGHPEWGHTEGVETTTGPLGQGFANSVGMALAEAMLASRYGSTLVDHYTYVLASDGDLMEGISQEALALAGHLKLNKLIVLFDDNGISIDGALSLSDSTDQQQRFAASGWNTIAIDGHDVHAINNALHQAKASDRPTLIACKTVIGYGSPNKAGKSSVHGSPLGAEEIEATRKSLGWSHGTFDIPHEVRSLWQKASARAANHHTAWQKRWSETAKETQNVWQKAYQQGEQQGYQQERTQAIAQIKVELAKETKALATRVTSGRVLEAAMRADPTLVSGSADLSGSNGTKPAELTVIKPNDFAGRYIHWGIREHAMAAAMNGMYLHGGLKPVSGTFLVFADYCRPSLRLAALMGVPVVHVMTHDSIGVGEDGPTHQPVEHLAALRAIPNLHVFRPADAVEAAECWELALNAKTTPSVLALTRQNLPVLRPTADSENRSQTGAYEIKSAQNAKVTLFASGSEVSLGMEAAAQLDAMDLPTRVVSVPCMDLFLAQSRETQDQIIGDTPCKIAIEAAIRQGWDAIIGRDGDFVGMSSYGASAPYTELYKHFGITAEHVVAKAQARLHKGN